ncbi:23S rRNA (uracil(1939)-C(5))-methyltransferase RlmD [Treponema sp.]|uniref:23S rRNA (uracil(1939)-C(5))-methyltransferase RlmD n=1 Tax=Treponema sp. TaxID=166 RepID=UPI00298E46D6|nr:23S rRNA (uracil(1939)-C(5))-methyltransferase RlmD [Treponema sp.]MCQ2241461.1 23S rRNA (uracil(1939)-C(5))-methyltransferase RlmD [Treponema sp.]
MSEIVTADKMVAGGDCIGSLNGKKVFIPFAIPGEKIEVEITNDARDYCNSKILRVIEPSDKRVMPFCPLYTNCGGCNLQHIEYSFQKELRAQILRDAFEHEGIEIPEIEVVSGNDKGYRSRFQFHNGGLMGKRSNDIVRLEMCPCATEEINKYLKEVPFEERPEGRVHVFGTRHISNIPEGYDKIVVAENVEAEIRGKKNFKNQQRITPSGRKLKKQKQIKARYGGTTLNESTLCQVELLGKKLNFDIQGFFQSNLEVLEKSIPLVTGGLEGKNVLDMYSGCGTFSVFLADKFEKVTMVEHNKSAIVFAEQNMAGTKHESFGLSGAVWTKYHAEGVIKSGGEFDAVVIDPPRSGMEKEVCQWLQKSGIPHIRSVSCDIATHARDIKFLIRAGYKLEKLYLLDFYPQTGHIESLAILEK